MIYITICFCCAWSQMSKWLDSQIKLIFITIRYYNYFLFMYLSLPSTPLFFLPAHSFFGCGSSITAFTCWQVRNILSFTSVNQNEMLYFSVQRPTDNLDYIFEVEILLWPCLAQTLIYIIYGPVARQSSCIRKAYALLF